MSKHTTFILFFCAIVTVGLIYSLGVRGPFLLDDFHSLERIGLYGGVSDVSGVLRYIFGGDGTEWSRSLSYLSFLMNEKTWPVNAVAFKATNIFLHLLIGITIFCFLYQLSRRKLDERKSLFISAVASLIWLVHPLQVSTTLYVVQRMTQLSTLFSLLALIVYLKTFQQNSVCKIYLCIGVTFIFSVLGVLSKENALAIIWLMSAINLVFYSRNENSNLINIYKNLVNYTALALLLFFLVRSVLYTSNDFRVFTQLERVGIQGYVLMKYLGYWFWPFGADFTLFHDDIEWSVSNMGVGLKALWWLFHCGVVFIAWNIKEKTPLYSIAILIFYIGHIIESTFWPLELMFEHRNYLPSVGLSLIFSVFFVDLFVWLKGRGLKFLGLGAIATYLLMLLILLTYRVSLWGDYKILIFKWSAEHPQSLRAQTSLAETLEKSGFYKASLLTLNDIYKVDPNIGVRLQQINILCEIDDVSFGEDIKISEDEIRNSRFSSIIIFQLNRMVELKRTECAENYFDGYDFGGLLGFIESFNDLKRHPRYLAQYYNLVSKYYLSENEYALALMVMEKKYKVQPSIDNALAMADLSLRGRNIVLAEEYIEKADIYNEKRWFIDPKKDWEIQNLKNGVKYFENNQN